MALTKIGSIGIATGISLTGVTTTQDTKIGTGITLSPDGDGYYTGIVTATSYRGDVSNCTGVGQTNFIDAETINVSGITSVGAGITLSPDGDVFATGVCTATSFVGSGANLTGIVGLTGSTNNTVVTVTGSNAIAGEANLTYNGSSLGITRGDSGTLDGVIMTNSDSVNNGFSLGVSSVEDAFLWNGSNTNMTFATNNAERMRLDSSGRLLIGTTDIDSVSDGEVPKLIIKATDSTAAAAFVRHSANAAGTGIFFGKSRNATVGSNTIVQSGDELGRITFSGDDGTNINTMGSKIASYVDGTPGENDMPGRLVFYTTADGASTPTERLRITSGGDLYVGTTDPYDAFSSSRLYLDGYVCSARDDTTVADGNGIGGIRFYSNDTNINSGNWLQVGGISCDADGDFLSGDAPTRLTFSTMTDGTTTLVERLRIDSSGNVMIGRSDGSKIFSLRETDTTTGVHIVQTIGGANHVASYAVGLGFDTEGYAARNKIAIVAEGTGSGYSRGKLHFLLDAANDSGEATLAESRMTILDSGSVLVGTTADSSPDGFAHLVQVNADNHTGGISIGRHTANSNGPCLLFHKTRSGSATPGTGVLSNGDNMGTIRFYGSDGTDSNSSAAQIQCHIDATPGSNDMPGRLTFGTTRDGDSSAKESMRIDSYGSLIQSGGHCSGAQMDSYTPGSDSLPKFFQSDGGTNNKSGDFWTTVLNVGTSHPTWDLFSIKGSTNFGIWVEVTCYFSQITSGTYGRQKVAYRVQRNGNNNFGTGVTNPYDKVENNNDKFIPTISTSGSGSSMRATFRIQGTGLTNYCQTMYHIRWVCGDNGAEPIVYY
tara:strand:- start:6134 stop:8614 length:2481 start_codon:yes stop_codon:yes gene_type:complete